MIVNGQYTSAEIFAEHIEEAALQWIELQCNHPSFKGIPIVQMPDVHAGNSCNVGTAYKIGAYVNPDHVGVDIGCTISMHKLSSLVASGDFALLNHKIRDRIFAILKKLCKAKCVESIFTTHNYIDVCGEYPMLRKGAVKAEEGERLCLPFNMRDGIAICIGKGNAEWNCSAPHGAGRIMSRNAAKKSIDMEDFERSMTGIFSTSVCPATLDESPQAYKPMDEILRLIEPTAEVVTMVKTRINIKDIRK